MSEENNTIQFQLGQITGQLTALVASMTLMANDFKLFEERLRKNENNTSILTLKMGMIATVCGALGSLLCSYIISKF